VVCRTCSAVGSSYEGGIEMVATSAKQSVVVEGQVAGGGRIALSAEPGGGTSTPSGVESVGRRAIDSSLSQDSAKFMEQARQHPGE